MSAKLTQIVLVIAIAFVVYSSNMQVSYQSCKRTAILNQLHRIEQINKANPINLQEQYMVQGSLVSATKQYAYERMECE